MDAFFELRTYKIVPGKMSEWVEFMEKTIMPYQVSKGMVINGLFKISFKIYSQLKKWSKNI